MDADVASVSKDCPKPQANAGAGSIEGGEGERGWVAEGADLLAYPHSG